MSWVGSIVRRARLRGLIDGLVQRVRSEVFDGQARDKVERHQDYGFAANPVDGEGLVIEVGGHTLVLRMDRTAERPELAPYEVCLWHKGGQRITLKDDGLAQVDCVRFVVNASEKVQFNSPTVEGSGNASFAGTVEGQEDVIFGGKSSLEHRHANIRRGTEVSDPPQ